MANSKKLWTFRNRLYSFKYINACWLNQFLGSYWQSGGNMNETMHKWIEDQFPWIMRQVMGLERVPSFQQIKKFSYNFMKSGKLINISRDDIKRRCTYFSEELNDQLYELFSTCIQIDKLRTEKLDSSYGCGLLYFQEAERRLEILLHYFKWYKSIKKERHLKGFDYDMLIDLVTEYEEDKFDQLVECIQSSGNEVLSYEQEHSIIANEMIKDIIHNEKTLQYWMKKTKYRIDPAQIETFITDYWAGQNDSDDASSSSDGDLFLNGESDDEEKYKKDDNDHDGMSDDNEMKELDNTRGIKLCNFFM